MTAATDGHVVATAGHVDHGKSALVRALTGIEPDRWDEERRRGLTIGLGYAWTGLPSGRSVAFVDVPGHERFVTTMLAGVGPVTAVLFIVAADEGWSQQSQEHLDALDALGIGHVLLAVTKTDLAGPEPVAADAAARIRATRLGRRGPVPWVGVSARTGEGLPELRALLDRLLGELPAAAVDAPLRLWVDRSFAIRGAGTVVTGTLGAGRLEVGSELLAVTGGGPRPVTIRGLQSEGSSVTSLEPTRRAAVNLRGVDHDLIGRGGALLDPDRWLVVDTVDVAARGMAVPGGRTVVHIGSAAVAATARPLGEEFLRLRLDHALPLVVGDRLLLRDPGAAGETGPPVAAVDVVDLAPTPLRRRGAAAARAAELAAGSGADAVISRRGAVPAGWLAAAGHGEPGGDAVLIDRWWVSRRTLDEWGTSAAAAVAAAGAAGVALSTLRQQLGTPTPALLAAALGNVPDLVVADGRVRERGAQVTRSAGLVSLLSRLAADPFDSPDVSELAALAIPGPQLTGAVAAGDLVELARGVYVAPAAVTRAATDLAGLPREFTAAQARAALGLTRRVAIPLLEHLDRIRVTRRVDDRLRTLATSGAARRSP